MYILNEMAGNRIILLYVYLLGCVPGVYTE